MNTPRALTHEQEKWIKALELGKYTQTKNKLKHQDSFCCLGVACDVSGLATWCGSTYMGTASFLPSKVFSWLGLLSDRGTIRQNYVDQFYKMMSDLGFVYSHKRVPHTLSVYNDSGATFAQLAATIRAYPDAVFK